MIFDPTDEPSRLGLRRADRLEAAWLAAAPAARFDELHQRIDDFLNSKELDEYRALSADRRRRSWLLGRFAAKRAAAAYLGAVDLRAMAVARGLFGQPLLRVAEADAPGLSISHAGALAVAVAHPAGHPLAVDYEEIRPGQADAIASQLTPRENAWAGRDHPRLTVLWTAKEALSKALRCGLTAPFRLFETAELSDDTPGRVAGRFENFTQYRFVSTVSADSVLTLVLPLRTELAGAPFDDPP
ncbi:MAG TPA: 4'-phosphopantetheinyl transferase superfamily protein [Isosphaeraceae bacterium]|nr:4'-phosphopantetheinyl transferase superfamily protein [Isosphaeraceae bacterium]